MGSRGTSLCWTLLDSIAEETTPSAFGELCEVIGRVANDLKIECAASPLEPPLVESMLWSRMVGAVNRSRAANGKVRPTISTCMIVNGESWHVICRLTAIPHLEVVVTERTPPDEAHLTCRYQVIQALVEQAAVQGGAVQRATLSGGRWQLYLYLKIRLSKRLRCLFMDEPYLGHSALVSPDRVFRGLADTAPTTVSIRDDGKEIEGFLDRCDNALLSHVGHQGLSQYLTAANMTVDDFLAAQKQQHRF